MKINRIITTLILFSAIFLSACSQPKIHVKDDISIGSIGNNATIIIDDARPQSDKDYSIGSMMVYSENYGIWTLGDEMFVPNTIELLKKHINYTTSKWKDQPRSINIKLKRLKFEANHQADLLVAGSSQLGPLGKSIAEAMHGKKFEMNYDKTRPYVLGYIDADVVMTFSNGAVKKRALSAYKAENFSSHMDAQGRQTAATKAITALYSTFSKSL